MKLSEAYKILELKEGASESEINKQFRKLAAKYHPDVNKSPEAENKSKEISQAYNILKDPLQAAKENNYSKSVWESVYRRSPKDIMDFMEEILKKDIKNNYYTHYDDGVDGANYTYSHYETPRPTPPRKKVNPKKPVKFEETISFVESVLGCQKKFVVERYVRCEPCLGAGFITSFDTCLVCNGKGTQIDIRQFNGSVLQVEQLCYACTGSKKVRKGCITCDTSGEKQISSTIEIRIPAGAQEGSILKIPKMGHYNGYDYDYAYLLIHVIPENNMKLSGEDVISILEIDLLESLQGAEKIVNTVHGDKSIEIKPGTRNKDEVILSGHGVNGRGNHKFILDVKLPDNNKIKKIVKYIKNLEKSKEK